MPSPRASDLQRSQATVTQDEDGERPTDVHGDLHGDLHEDFQEPAERMRRTLLSARQRWCAVGGVGCAILTSGLILGWAFAVGLFVLAALLFAAITAFR